MSAPKKEFIFPEREQVKEAARRYFRMRPPTDMVEEQFEFVIDHVRNGACDCPICLRYVRIAGILMEIFDDQ